MKIGTMIPAIIALGILIGAPFGTGPLCDADPHGGLICYCCSVEGKSCTMISCAGCCGSHSSVPADRWSPEMIPEQYPLMTPLKVAYSDREIAPLPETVYIEVRRKPPKFV